MRELKIIEKIIKGWSGDEKFLVCDKTGEKYLLRCTLKEKRERKVEEFHVMQQVAKQNIPICLPVEITCDEVSVSLLQTWIEGVDCQDVINTFSDAKQYQYGVDAGRILAKIHREKADDKIDSWEDFFNKKIDRKLEMYEKCHLKYENGEAFVAFIKDNRHLLNNRPVTFQHGDYHIGNMLIDTNGVLNVIDFEKFDYGDPWEEFNRIHFTVQNGSPLLASGMIDGYFNCQIPENFWDLLALYVANNIIGSLSWAVSYGGNEVEVMQGHAKEILNWYDNMQTTRPNWYCGKSK